MFYEPSDKAGGLGAAADVYISPPTWDPSGVGTGYADLQGQRWTYYDYRDTLPISEASEVGTNLLQGLGLDPGTPESRQCLLLSVAGGILLHRTGVVPSLAEVHETAAQLRSQLVCLTPRAH